MKSMLFVYGLTYGGALASFINPFVGLLVYIWFAVVRPEKMWPWGVPPGNYSRVVGIALLAGWALHGFGRWDLGRARAVITALVGYFLWVILSAVKAPDQPVAWAVVELKSKIIIPILVGITTINSLKQLKIFAWVLLVGQAYPAYELNMTYFGGYNQLREEGFADMDNNSYAIALVTSSGLAFFLFLYSEKWWQKAIAAASAAFMVHAVLFSFSRGGMLGLAILSLAIFVLMSKGWKECLAFLLAAVVGLSLAGSEVRARFVTTFADKENRDASAESRIELWTACWDTMLMYPAFGAGPDHMPLRMEQYGFRRGKEAHTLWLQVGAELGFPGVLMLLSYYGICILRLWPIARGKAEVADPWLTYLARMVIASLIGFAVSAQFVSLDDLEPPYYIALLGAGVLKLSSQSLPPAQGSESLDRQQVEGTPPHEFDWVNNQCQIHV
jgi:probable O-glycosylation ligase (exosortase A-associated)